MGDGINSDSVREGVGGLAAGVVGDARRQADGALQFAQEAAGAIGMETGEDSLFGRISNWISNIFSFISRWLGNMFDPNGRAAGEALTGAMEGVGNYINSIGQAFGLSNGTAASEIINDAIESFQSSAMRSRGDNANRDVRTAILALRTSLVSHYTEQLAQQYPAIASAHPDRIEDAAERLANVVVGYPNLPETANETILLSSMGDPAAGSVGAAMRDAQRRARGEDRESVTIGALRVDQDAVRAIHNSLTTGAAASPPAQPAASTDIYARGSALYNQVNGLIRTISDNGGALKNTYDADSNGSVSVAEVVAHMRSQGVTEITDAEFRSTYVARERGAQER